MNKQNEFKETTRIETFSDGVFAIAITLLVLELISLLHVPSSESLFKNLIQHWQSFIAFLIGFATILICWINHHVAFEHIKKVDNTLMWINGFLLFIVTLTPFPTAVLAEYFEKESRFALGLFGLNYLFISITADAICSYAYKKNFVDEEHKPFYKSYKLLYRYAIYYNVIAFLFCFISIAISILMYCILFIIFASPKSFASKLHKHRILNKSKP